MPAVVRGLAPGVLAALVVVSQPPARAQTRAPDAPVGMASRAEAGSGSVGAAGSVPGRPARRTLTLVLDPGHGGSETGAEGKTGVFEKDITLDVARRLKSLLAGEPGLEVLLTREEDEDVALDDRTALANQKHADLFLSIHVNASPRRDARGAETYFLSRQAKDEEVRTLAALENNAADVDRERLGEAPEGLELVLWDLAQSQYLQESAELAVAIQEQLNEALGLKDRGVKQAPFRVLMGATMPAVLVEVGFISNPAEEAVLGTGEYRDKIAQALARALVTFVSDAKRRLAGAPTRSR